MEPFPCSSSSDVSSAERRVASASTPFGLFLHSSPAIHHFLAETESCSNIPLEIKKLALEYAEHPTVPFAIVRDVWKHTEVRARPRLCVLLSGSSLALETPKPREKSKELKERLQKLQEEVEWKTYRELVKDVTGPAPEDQQPFASYKDQLGFGLHVMVTMFTGFMAGYFLFRSQFQHNPALHAAGGVLGLCGGMLVETLLFIVHAYQLEKASKVHTKSFGLTRRKPYPTDSKASILKKKRQ